MKVLFSFFDHSGNASRPYKENGWEVIQIDIKSGKDIMDFNPILWLNEYQHQGHYTMPEIGLIFMVPCTAYALCGNKHKKTTKHER
jgi:hypothetical protein